MKADITKHSSLDIIVTYSWCSENLPNVGWSLSPRDFPLSLCLDPWDLDPDETEMDEGKWAQLEETFLLYCLIICKHKTSVPRRQQ